MCEELRIRRQGDGQVETRELVRVFNMEYFGNPHRNVSESVATRFFHHCDISFKTNERRHMRQDLRESIDYYRKVESFDPTKAKDVDEVSISPKAFERNKGFSPRGDPSEKIQIKIGNKYYSAIAMLGYYGVEAVDIFEGTINSATFATFLNTHCAAVIDPAGDEWGMFDNASIHKTIEGLLAIEALFGGKWTFVPAYSPHLKPVELLFALVKQYLRKHEDEALVDPLRWINKAFDRYRPNGSHAHVIPPLWNKYVHKHQRWLHGL